MTTSTYLARLIGPVLLVAAVGALLNREAYKAMAQEFLRSPALIYLSGVLTMLAGVAVVLWVAEQLKRDHDGGRLKHPVVVALFGGEEGGLWGSRQFAQVVGSPSSPVAKPLLAINVDGVGSRGDEEVFLVGRSHHAPLSEAFEAALQDSRLKPGKDIDRFAFEHGSDHWPLHQAGIAAVTVFSADYRAMNTLDDRLARVDVAHLRELAKVVYRMVRGLAAE